VVAATLGWMISSFQDESGLASPRPLRLCVFSILHLPSSILLGWGGTGKGRGMNGRGIKARNHFRKIPLTSIPLTPAEFFVGLRLGVESRFNAAGPFAFPDILRGWQSFSPALAEGTGLRWVNVPPI